MLSTKTSANCMFVHLNIYFYMTALVDCAKHMHLTCIQKQKKCCFYNTKGMQSQNTFSSDVLNPLYQGEFHSQGVYPPKNSSENLAIDISHGYKVPVK